MTKILSKLLLIVILCIVYTSCTSKKEMGIITVSEDLQLKPIGYDFVVQKNN